MDKLLELLKLKDGYEHIIGKKQSDGGYMFWLDDIAYREERILGKKFGFIKWLVENDKVDFNKMEEKSEYTFIKNGGGEHIIEDLLMLLSIQDSPVEFLCEILR